MKGSKTVNVHQAKTHLSRLLADVEKGREVVVARAGKPVAKLVPFAARAAPRTMGRLQGKIWISPDFDAPLSEGELKYDVQAIDARR